MFRLIVIALAMYIGYRLIVNILKPAPTQREKVGGETTGSEPIDLEGKDVEDAKYKDIEE